MWEGGVGERLNHRQIVAKTETVTDIGGLRAKGKEETSAARNL